MNVSGFPLAMVALLGGAGLTYLLRPWKLAASLLGALICLALWQMVAFAPPAEAVRLGDLLLWPGAGQVLPLEVTLGAPWGLAGREWALEGGDPWVLLPLAVGAGASLAGWLAGAAGPWTALVLVAAAGIVGEAGAQSPALGLLGGGLTFCSLAMAVAAGRREAAPAAMSLLACGLAGLALLVPAGLVWGQSGPSTWGAAALAAGLAFWLGVPPWGAWQPAATRQGGPLAAALALACLPLLALFGLRGAASPQLNLWLLGGSGWLLVLSSLGALVHREPQRLWGSLALANLGMLLGGVWRFGADWVGLTPLLGMRGLALAAVALGLSWLPPGLGTGVLRRRPWSAALALAGLASLVGLPLTPGWAGWWAVLWRVEGGFSRLPAGWVALVVAALVCGLAGLWRVALGWADRPAPADLRREEPWQVGVAFLLLAALFAWGLAGLPAAG
ncbi:MAG: hypothetical protein GX605_12040 [Chloroflexi bacterium]|nr:hypothetical protein [Chloroflexota bacterium]